MFCRNCGAPNDDNAYRCVECETVLQKSFGGQPSVSIPNYLVQSILVTVFCCLPLGIPAIVFAAQVNNKIAAGDYEGAKRSSEQAKLWSWISFWAYLAFLVACLAFIVFVIYIGAMNAR